MKRSHILILAGGVIASVLIVILLLTLVFGPENTNPAFATAVRFVQSAAAGDDASALALLGAELQSYVAENCPDASIAACVRDYTPPDWGELMDVSFRRAAPDGSTAWDVDLIATYAAGTGASGVCIYNRVEQTAAGDWQVVGWAGWLHCGDSASRHMATNPDTPNRVP
jgi:hypothetical protein